MRVIWLSKNQIVATVPSVDLPRFAVASSKEEWASTGERLFKHKRYMQAKHCFEKADMHRELAVADAYLLRETARALPLTSKNVGKAFLRAASAFLLCAEMPTTPEKGKRAYYRNAADCYVKNGDIRKAAQAFYDAKAFTHSAEQYRKAGLFDDVVQIIRSHKNEMESNIVDELRDVCRLYYLREHKLKQAKALFSSAKEAAEFAADYDLDVARAGLLEDEGHFADAGEIHLAAGRTLQAINMFLKKRDDQSCMRRASASVLRGLWTHLSFGVSPESAMSDKELEDLFAAAARLNPEFLEAHDVDEMTMFKAILSNNFEQLQCLGRNFAQAGNKPAALLCLDHVFAVSPQLEGLQGLSVHALVPSLEIFLVYANLLHDIVFLPDPCDKLLVQKLFAFQIMRDDKLSITTGTFLHREAGLSFGGRDKSRTIPRVKLVEAFKRALCERLQRVVVQEYDVLLATKSISPCLAALVSACNDLDCPGSHVDKAILDPDWYNTLIRVYLQQVLILQTLHSVEPRSEQQARQRLLLERFYEALNPCFDLLGSPFHIMLSRMPEAKQALAIVNDWNRHLISTLDAHEISTFLTTFLRATSLGFALDREGMVTFIPRAPCLAHAKPPSSLVRRELSRRKYIVHDVVDALHGVKLLSLSGGVHFVRHVVQKNLPIDISVLCDFIEYLCASLVIYKRSQHMSTLHDVTLPRSWLLRWLIVFRTGHSSSMKICSIFADSMLALLHRLQTGQEAGHLYLPDSTIVDAVKSFSIARICRALCLLGHNIGDNILRDKIGNGITSLETDGSHSSLSYCRYTKAKRWDDLVGAVQQTTNESPMDELICLCQKDRDPLSPIGGVRLVPFNAVEEIPYSLGYDPLNAPLLGSRPQNDATPSRPTPAATPDHPVAQISILQSETKTRHTASHPAPLTIPSGQQGGSADLSVGDGDEETHLGDAEDDNDADELQNDEEETTTPHNNATPPSQDQINAVRVCQSTYRRIRRLRKSAKALSLADRTRIFRNCLAVSQKMNWKRRDYCFLFLGPLPHVLLCLEQVRTHAYELKKDSNKRLLTAEHQELEDAQLKSDQARTLMKMVERLQKLLEPKAAIHKQCDLKALKTYVQEAESLVRGSARAIEVQEDLYLGVKGILAEASQKNK